MTRRAWPRAAVAGACTLALAAGACGGARPGATASGVAGAGPASPGESFTEAPLRVTVRGDVLVPQVATAFAVGGGRVLTVAHVLDGGGAVRVAGRPARVLRVDPRLDLAVLAAPGLRGRTARFATAGGASRVQVLRGGRPRALAARVRRRATATVKGPSRTDVRPALELAVTVQPGDSGAPVTDRAGRVLGIVFARGPQDTAWAVDAAAVRAVLSASSTSRRPPGS